MVMLSTVVKSILPVLMSAMIINEYFIVWVWSQKKGKGLLE